MQEFDYYYECAGRGSVMVYLEWEGVTFQVWLVFVGVQKNDNEKGFD